MSTRTQAFVNFYAAIGTMETYAKLDEKAKELAAKQNIAVRFKVKEGPDGVLIFNNGAIKAVPYVEGMTTDIVLSCSSPEKFNDVVNGSGTPLPTKGFFKLGFMMKKDSAFNILSTKMAEIMRKKEFDSEEEKRLSTLLAFNAMVAALAQIGNVDELGMYSAKNIPDGDISIEITDVCYCTIRAKGGKLQYIGERSDKPRSKMVFDTLETAKDVIDSKVDAMSCIATGRIAMSGFIPMLQNLNNILNLVPKYLS